VPRKFVSPTQAAEMYGISRRSIHRYITQGLLPAYRIGPCNIRLDADEVERILLGNRMGAMESVEHSA
jgi:excisionase family DNA binding protein